MEGWIYNGNKIQWIFKWNMAEKRVCKKHVNKVLEAFCFDCKGEEELMCSICLCEHQTERHKTKATHITTIIEGVLAKFAIALQKTDEHHRQIVEYSRQAEDLMTSKESIRHQLEEKLQNLREFYKTQKALVASTNSALLNCNEKILKEAQKCENRLKEHIKDPVDRRVHEMIVKEDYWVAYEEAKRALAEDTTIDDKEIKKQLETCQDMKKKYQDQLIALDVIHLHISEYEEMKATIAANQS